MNNLQVLGKFLDQPILVAKFQKAVPVILTAGAIAYTANDVRNVPKEKRKKKAIKTGITMGVTVASALAAPHIASKVAKRALPDGLEILKYNNKKLVDTFIRNNDVDKLTFEILEKSKEKILGFKEVKTLFENINEKTGGKEFLERLIPSPQNISAKDIFSEIGYLSVYGAVPVLGGVAGGTVADFVADKKSWKKKFPNKVKEGSYQYLANIFMCNVGAGMALAIMEKFGIKSKAARAIGMTAGIIITGVLGGSKIANLIGKYVIDPIFNKNENLKKNKFNVFDIDYTDENVFADFVKLKTQKIIDKPKDRTPEPLDIGLHTDDIATVSLLSGLKWIEPALPLMYSISGYRAGIGYRN